MEAEEASEALEEEALVDSEEASVVVVELVVDGNYSLTSFFTSTLNLISK